MFKIYGSKKCPDCRSCKINFDHYKIEYEFIEVLDNLKNLKTFLHYRDTRKDVFERLIKIGDIGLPAIVDENDNVFTDWEKYLLDQNLDIIYSDNESCSLGSKGC